jgi:EAL domain-containing protein (putative c-di-GMP-specific phosphodiesterase class I)/FixJ family two-component response regulator
VTHSPKQHPEGQPGIDELRFLVVEDHGFQRWALANLLSGLGAKQVFSAPDGQSALDIIENTHEAIDIIVSDLDMPGMDGIEFIRHVGSRKMPGSIILASALDRSLIASVEAMAKEYGVHLLAALQKPVTPKKIEWAIRRYDGRAGRHAAPSRELHGFTADEIREGIERDQFEPFFQAKVRMSDATVAGAEALARWRHPTKGLLLAGAFMDSIHDAELNERFATLMLRKAARACRTWTAVGRPGAVSVNLSLDALEDLALADRLMACMAEHELPPKQMILEVTESAAATPQSLENLSRLRMKGFGLSIDDYGIGYSSMERLTRIAFTELKIDRSFVRNGLAGGSNRAMLESSLEMARKLGIPAVAEGVELQVEWDLLRELGCDLAQGFMIARPIDEIAYLEWLRQSGPRS